MAYNNADEKRTELGRFKRNDRGEYIVITQIDNDKKDNTDIDIRTYFTSDSGDVLPTQKGVRFNAEFLEDMIEALQKSVDGDIE